MGSVNFNELEWHDAVIKNIIIDRSNPGYNDMIEMLIIWPSGIENKLTFKDVYFANLSLNFGVVAYESIMTASIVDSSDPDLLNVIQLWERHYGVILEMSGFEILTNSTGNIIRIFALSFEITNS